MGLQGKEAGRRGELAEKTQQGWAARQERSQKQDVQAAGVWSRRREWPTMSSAVSDLNK